MYRAYLDDSGSDDTPVLCIWGVLSPREEWEQLEEKWSLALQRYDVKIFHMSDLENLKREFDPSKGWTKERRESLLRELLPIMNQHIQHYIGCNASIKYADFKRYHDAGIQCMQIILRKLPPEQKVEILFEKTQRLTGTVIDTFRRLINTKVYELLSIIDCAGKEIIPLQIADLIAHEYRELLMHPKSRGLRWTMQQIMRDPKRCMFLAI